MTNYESPFINGLKKMCTDTQLLGETPNTMQGVPSQGIEILPTPTITFVKLDIQQEVIRGKTGDFRVRLCFDFFEAEDHNAMLIAMCEVHKTLELLDKISGVKISKLGKRGLEFWFCEYLHEAEVTKALQQII